jgi:hypothetical protein
MRTTSSTCAAMGNEPVAKLPPQPGATTNHKILSLHYALTTSFSSGHAPPLPLRQQAHRPSLAVCCKRWLERTRGARPQVRPSAGRLFESTTPASRNQCPCPRRQRNDRFARRARRCQTTGPRPISPPVRSNLGVRNTPASPNPACQEQSRPPMQTPTLPNPAWSFTCRPFGAIQHQKHPQDQELDELGALRTMYPPNPPRWSWQLKVGSDPDPGD